MVSASASTWQKITCSHAGEFFYSKYESIRRINVYTLTWGILCLLQNRQQDQVINRKVLASTLGTSGTLLIDCAIILTALHDIMLTLFHPRAAVFIGARSMLCGSRHTAVSSAAASDIDHWFRHPSITSSLPGNVSRYGNTHIIVVHITSARIEIARAGCNDTRHFRLEN
jgi:hypothetical protein